MTDRGREQEWSDQERALRAEREGQASDGAGPRLAQYRLLARILREPVHDALPSDFAAQVAVQAETGQGAGERIERWTERALVAALALAAVIFSAAYAPLWLQNLFGNDAGSVGSWLLAIGACIVLSLLVDLASRRVTPVVKPHA